MQIKSTLLGLFFCPKYFHQNFICSQLRTQKQHKAIDHTTSFITLLIQATMSSTIAGLYFAMRNNVFVESILNKFPTMGTRNPSPCGDDVQDKEDSTRNRMAALAAFTNRALTIAVLCNMHRFPIRVPIIMVLTPPIARVLARKYYETGR